MQGSMEYGYLDANQPAFARQTSTFLTGKGMLLACKRASFALQKATVQHTKGCILRQKRLVNA